MADAKENLKKYWWIFLIIFVVLCAIIVAIVILKRRNKIEDKTVKPNNNDSYYMTQSDCDELNDGKNNRKFYQSRNGKCIDVSNEFKGLPAEYYAIKEFDQYDRNRSRPYTETLDPNISNGVGEITDSSTYLLASDD